jgi:uncharacterized membrane protein YhaH (DUF805 family)
MQPNQGTSPMEYFFDAFRKYADFSGRTTLREYWMFMLFYTVVYLVLMIVDGAVGRLFFTAIFSVISLVPSISITTRRLHDTGRSGWWQLIAIFLPLLGLIILIVLVSLRSDADNIYGPRAMPS